MRSSVRLAAGLAAAIGAFATASATMPAQAQGVGMYFAPKDQVVAIRAGRLFDSRNGALLTNQVIIIRGDKISEVGNGIEIPSGATLIDLSAATVMPGMI